jgi:hypothetical protein
VAMSSAIRKRSIKHLIIAVSLFSIAGCQNSGTDEGYEVGYNLACGFPTSKANKLVIQSQFANNFLDGARACAHDHPARARRVLGLAQEESPAPAAQASAPTAPMAAEQPMGTPLPESGRPQIQPVPAPMKSAQAHQTSRAAPKEKPLQRASRHSNTKTAERARVHAKPKAGEKAKVATKTKPHTRTTTSVRTRTASVGKAHAKQGASEVHKTAAVAKPQPRLPSRALTATSPGQHKKSHASNSRRPAAPVMEQSSQTAPPPRKTVDSYLGFMGN